MTTPSAIELIAEVGRAGGWLTPNPNGTLGVDLPPAETPRLLEAIRQRKHDLLMLLRYPATACPACSGDRYWRDTVGLWRCERCEPDSPPDPFGPLPAGEAAAAGELELRAKLREPRLARLLVGGGPHPPTVRRLQIRAAALVWAADGPEGIARRRAESWTGIPPSLIAGRAVRFRATASSPAIGEWVRTPGGRAGEVLAYDGASGEALVRSLAEPPRWAWHPPAALVAEMDWGPRA